MITFGPVPSRRLGYSLGINHIPPKQCPYSCVYCQVGRTTALTTTRREYYPLAQILREVEIKLRESETAGRAIDYLTLVPDGEPSLDKNLAKLIGALQGFQMPVAVISNAALIDQFAVQDALLQADWVSLKIDALQENDWRRINRPHHRLALPSILDGVLKFRNRFRGEFVTETMLVSGVNDSAAAIENLANFLLEVQPFKAYLSIPIRPPAEAWVKPPAPEALQRVLHILAKKVSFIDLLFETEAADFVSTGDIIEDILSITAVHPLREEALRNMLAQAGTGWFVVEELLSSHRIARVQYGDETYYLHCFEVAR